MNVGGDLRRGCSTRRAAGDRKNVPIRRCEKEESGGSTVEGLVVKPESGGFDSDRSGASNEEIAENNANGKRRRRRPGSAPAASAVTAEVSNFITSLFPGGHSSKWILTAPDPARFTDTDQCRSRIKAQLLHWYIQSGMNVVDCRRRQRHDNKELLKC
ncbi:hypothetical protein EVAR_52905_1 [Eumeta japonica]|uniref:Uncharacterized protein n=1 Tax=Eumeta variegata TaxID=151549 RepID=A0A4C1Y897_EUMVA|nr:hypothetical protein EVAR_52905_1 [Eumeta japonica]